MNTQAVNSRSVVLVGAGQFIQRGSDPATALEPLAMMAAAAEAAAHDAGCGDLLAALDSVRVVKGAWPYRDPGRLLAQRLGASPRDSRLSFDGGNTPQSLVNATGLEIEAGRMDVALLVGAEGIYSRRRAKRAGATIPYTSDAEAPPAETIGHDVTMSSRLESSRGLEMPVNIYPMFETAIRHARGETPAQHLARISALWAAFNAVAVDNPYAWLRTPMTAAEIRTPSANNRLVGYPYTKSMNSNWDLDQAAAVILCSVEKARSLGISRDRWVFPWAGTDAHDTYLVSNRDNFHSSPAIRTAALRCRELAGIELDQITHVDLYSCFPSAVQIAAAEIGLAEDRSLTVTGGLPFAGGPLNNYVMHSIATMAHVLRADPGTVGLVSANGGYVTKHAIGLYSTEPPPAGQFRHADVQDEVDRFPTREVTGEHVGPATVEAYTVMHDHTGPVEALVSALTPAGLRTYGRSRDGSAMASLMARDAVGDGVEIDADAVAHL
ncbi:MAG: acetyl-CoA acetyltransferase [Acidimicrobiales bacterium]